MKMEFLLGNPYSTPVGQCIGTFYYNSNGASHKLRVEKHRVAFILLIQGIQVCATGNNVTLAFSGHHRGKCHTWNKVQANVSVLRYLMPNYEWICTTAKAPSIGG